MRKHVENVTPEEIAAMHDRNENFIGTHANFQKMALYREIQADLTEFLRKSPDVVNLSI